MRTQFAGALLVALMIVLAGAALPAHAAAARVRSPALSHQTISFAEFGYREDITLTGLEPKFSIFLPVYPGLRAAAIYLPLKISPIVDPRSTISVFANGTPVFAATVKTLGLEPELNINIPVPPDQKSIQLTISASLFVVGEVCYQLPTSNLWFVIKKEAALGVDTVRNTSDNYIYDFLRDYAGRINVIVPPAASFDQALSASRLAYFLHQINRWRRLEVRYGAFAEPGDRNVFVGDFKRDLAVRGRNLEVSWNGVGILRGQIDKLLLSNSVSSASFDQSALELPRGGVTFDDLGVPTQTVNGVGDMPFSIPFPDSAVGGAPGNLHLDLWMSHSRIVGDDRAQLNVFVNGTLVDSYTMRPDGGKENFIVPIDGEVLQPLNEVRVVPTYFFKRDGCASSYPQMTVSLLNESAFTWDRVERQRLSVGDFLKTASGRVVVLVQERALVPAAFDLLDTLGNINSTVKQLDVRPFTGEVPSGYDYAIVIARPKALTKLSVPLLLSGQSFVIRDPLTRKVAYQADYSDPFGVLETTLSNNTPTMVESYWRERVALEGVPRIAVSELANQADNIFLFNREHVTYGFRKPIFEREKLYTKLLKTATLPLILMFAIAAPLTVLFATRRRRKRKALPPKS